MRNRKSELGGITGLGENAKFNCCRIEFEVTVGNVIRKSHCAWLLGRLKNIHRQIQNPVDP